MGYVKRIRIKNFRNLEDVEIEVKPLTLLFGSNGSGKSTFIQAMMFLQKNLYPVNKGKTIYNLSKDINLISFQETVSGNDITRDIVFSIDIEGEFDFPSEKIFREDFFDSENKEFSYKWIDGIEIQMSIVNKNLNDTELIFENLQKVNPKEFFSKYKIFFEKYVLAKFKDERKKFFEKRKIKFTYSIFFQNDPLGYNFKKLVINDNENENSVNIEALYTSSKNDQRFYVVNDFCKFINGNETYERVVGLDNIHRNEAGSYESTYDPPLDYFSFPERFNIMSELNVFMNYEEGGRKIDIELTELLNVYFDVSRFNYFSEHVVLGVLYDFINLKHLPITRELPKLSYKLGPDNFEIKEYYNLLNDIFNSQYEQKILEYLRIYYENFVEYFKKEKYESIENFLFQWLDTEESSSCIDRFGYIITINYILLKLKLDLLIIKIDNKNNLGNILFKTKNNLIYNFINGSSGLKQVLPIILFLFNPKQSTTDFEFYKMISEDKDNNSDNFCSLFIEQPELHLHPKLQADLAWLLSKTCYTNLYKFIETHSEHLIKKIQVMIAKGEFNKDVLSVIYFENKEGSTKVKKMEINEHGFFKEPWPDGFFDDSANLSWELLTANKN